MEPVWSPRRGVWSPTDHLLGLCTVLITPVDRSADWSKFWWSGLRMAESSEDFKNRETVAGMVGVKGDQDGWASTALRSTCAGAFGFRKSAVNSGDDQTQTPHGSGCSRWWRHQWTSNKDKEVFQQLLQRTSEGSHSYCLKGGPELR